MKKIIILMVIGMLLVLPLVVSKQVDKIDWKTSGLEIREDGIYRNNGKIVEKDRAEIWIEKKVPMKPGQYLRGHEAKHNYHIDSLVEEDVRVKVRLYYEIQPDVIYYRSHNGKYEGYEEWEWENCDEEECVGGYAQLVVYLEYGRGSNIFTDAISGATWNNDGIDITLVENTDYVVVGKEFQLINQIYDKSLVNISYEYTIDSNELDGISGNVTGGVESFFGNATTWFTLLAVVVIILIIALVIIAVNRFSGGGSGTIDVEEGL